MDAKASEWQVDEKWGPWQISKHLSQNIFYYKGEKK